MSDLRHNILGDVIQQSGCQPSRLSRLTWVLREADWERRLSDLLLEEILLVEEEDDGGVHEPLVVADGVEQFHALVHPESNKTVIRSEIWRLEVTRASYGLTLISLSFRAEHHMVWWPIRGQHPGHVITLDQSERSITWSDGGDNTWEDKWFLREIGSSEHPSLEVYLQTDVYKDKYYLSWFYLNESGCNLAFWGNPWKDWDLVSVRCLNYCLVKRPISVA